MVKRKLLSSFTSNSVTIQTFLKNIDTQSADSENAQSKFILSHLKEYHKTVVDSPISIKIVSEGTEHYKVNNQRYTVQANNYLIVNHGDEFEIDIHTPKITQGICIYPPKQIIEEAYNYRVQTKEQLLEQVDSTPFHFTQNNNVLLSTNTGRFLKEYLPRIIQNSEFNSPIDFHLIYMRLAEHLVQDQLNLNQQLLNLKSSKKHTKEELYRRLSTAREFIHAHYDQKINIDQLAAVSCLSKYHFVRSFRDFYQCTPYQYALNLKLEAAKKLIHQGHTYTSASEVVGFSDPKNLRKALIG
ncbi:helix-turn-helix transcriptional regulator [bacterium SCSIO 12643]|nr:helix-turn-helix transcriptional regulator [bacterium SCSIO 12643]